VLATERQRPKITPSSKDQPQSRLVARPSAVAIALCPNAPGTAILPTATISRAEKCRPTPNMSRTTPTSASSEAIEELALPPGVYGPSTTPANT
jgi:hypothetical protein